MSILVEICEPLHLKTDGSVSVRKVYPLHIDYISALHEGLSEWNNANDEKFYSDL